MVREEASERKDSRPFMHSIVSTNCMYLAAILGSVAQTCYTNKGSVYLVGSDEGEPGRSLVAVLPRQRSPRSSLNLSRNKRDTVVK